MAHSTVRRLRFGEPWEEIVSKRWAIRHRGDGDAVANEERMRLKRQRIDLGEPRNQVQLMGIFLRQSAITDAWAVCMRCDAAVCKAFSLHDLGKSELTNLVETCKYYNTVAFATELLECLRADAACTVNRNAVALDMNRWGPRSDRDMQKVCVFVVLLLLCCWCAFV